MNAPRRKKLAFAILGIALVAQLSLLGYMQFGPQNSYPGLQGSLKNLPTDLEVVAAKGPPRHWRGMDYTQQAFAGQDFPFAPKELLFRRYRERESAVEFDIFFIHTLDGEERKHHPEICVRDVAGIPEDPRGRAVLHLAKDGSRPVQRFWFKPSPTHTISVYYWHYTFLPNEQEGQSGLQRLYQTFHRKPPSLTVQLSTSSARERLEPVELPILIEMDRMVRKYSLPPSILMGCDRLPIGLATR